MSRRGPAFLSPSVRIRGAARGRKRPSERECPNSDDAGAAPSSLTSILALGFRRLRKPPSPMSSSATSAFVRRHRLDIGSPASASQIRPFRVSGRGRPRLLLQPVAALLAIPSSTAEQASRPCAATLPLRPGGAAHPNPVSNVVLDLVQLDRLSGAGARPCIRTKARGRHDRRRQRLFGESDRAVPGCRARIARLVRR